MVTLNVCYAENSTRALWPRGKIMFCQDVLELHVYEQGELKCTWSHESHPCQINVRITLSRRLGRYIGRRFLRQTHFQTKSCFIAPCNQTSYISNCFLTLILYEGCLSPESSRSVHHLLIILSTSLMPDALQQRVSIWWRLREAENQNTKDLNSTLPDALTLCNVVFLRSRPLPGFRTDSLNWNCRCPTNEITDTNINRSVRTLVSTYIEGREYQPVSADINHP